MEKKIVRKLPASAKTIKVMGQGCADDCMHYKTCTLVWRELINCTVCYIDHYKYTGVWYDAQTTSWF